MLFNSLEFVFFFAVVYLLFLSLSGAKLRYQNLMLLVASYVFYGSWNYKFLSLLFISTLVDYYCGLRIFQEQNPRNRKLFLFLSVCVNLGLLGFFKYYNFFITSVEDSLASFGVNAQYWNLDIVLPVGISFYTFQTMSYTIDIYYKKLEPTRNLLDFALFISFFPQLVAGPIVRARDLLPQLSQKRIYRPELVERGMFLIAQGYVKKVIFADNLGAYVDLVYKTPGNYGFIPTLIAIYAYAFQIYFDFSGYSDIAIGLANLMSIEIPINFNLPYLAKTFREFWQRWHISLSTWLRDYLYIPLGGNRISVNRTYINIMITMLLGGLWHGANWTFVLWGFYHGMLLIVERWIDAFHVPLLQRLKTVPAWSYVKMFFTFNLVCFGWVIFRSQSLSDFSAIIKNITSFSFADMGAANPTLILVLVAALSHFMRGKIDLEEIFMKMPAPVQGFAYAVITLAIYVFFTTEQRFIYFQF